MSLRIHVALFCFLLSMQPSLIYSAGLQCYNCSNVGFLPACHGVITCAPNQHCYKDTIHDGTRTYYNMGCRDQTACPGTTQIPGLIGRAAGPQERATGPQTCSQCCDNNTCAKTLPTCTTQPATQTTKTLTTSPTTPGTHKRRIFKFPVEKSASLAILD